jgi:hypothetical protein
MISVNENRAAYINIRTYVNILLFIIKKIY